MYRYKAITAALAFSIVSASATAQSDVDRAFTATDAKCEHVSWSRSALNQYPNIASACQDVMERDGKYYVKFSGTVRRVSGDSVTVNFRDGGTLTLTPPEDMSLYIDGRPRTVRSLRRGDALTFYVPQDNVSAPPPHLAIIPITRIHVAQATPAEPAPQAEPAQHEEHQAPELPKTASTLPLLGISGLMLTLFGCLPTRRRRK